MQLSIEQCKSTDNLTDVLPLSQKKHVLGFKICPIKHVVILNLACVQVHVGMQQFAPNMANKYGQSR
jgi:hypothetical protein